MQECWDKDPINCAERLFMLKHQYPMLTHHQTPLSMVRQRPMLLGRFCSRRKVVTSIVRTQILLSVNANLHQMVAFVSKRIDLFSVDALMLIALIFSPNLETRFLALDYRIYIAHFVLSAIGT
jgi:hypothetical protein